MAVVVSAGLIRTIQIGIVLQGRVVMEQLCRTRNGLAYLPKYGMSPDMSRIS